MPVKNNLPTVAALALVLAVSRTAIASGGPEAAEPAPSAPALMTSQSVDQSAGNPASAMRSGAAYGRWGFDDSGVDLKANPGDSFFDFASGRWDARTVIPADKFRFGVFDALAEKTLEQVRAIIERCRQVARAQHRRRQDRRALQRIHGRGADRTTRRGADRGRSRRHPRRPDQGRHRGPDGPREKRVRRQLVPCDGVRGRKGSDPQRAARLPGRVRPSGSRLLFEGRFQGQEGQIPRLCRAHARHGRLGGGAAARGRHRRRSKPGSRKRAGAGPKAATATRPTTR